MSRFLIVTLPLAGHAYRARGGGGRAQRARP